MAEKNFLVDINLNKNELLNARIQNVPTLPELLDPQGTDLNYIGWIVYLEGTGPYILNNVEGEAIWEPLGSGAGSGVFENDIVVNLGNITGTSTPKTLGQYESGDTIPATGKTFEEVMRMIAVEAIPPTATLTTSGSVAFNQPNVSITLNFSYTLNTPGANVVSAILQTRRGSSGEWITLSSDVSTSGSYIYSETGLTDRSSSFSFQYIVTDSNGMSVTKSASVTPAGYSAPSTSITTGNPTRELGNVSTTFVGTVNQTAQNEVSITSVTLQYSTDNSNWNDIASVGTTINYTHNNVALANSTIIYYRFKVDVSVVGVSQLTYLSLGNVSFVYKNTFGYSSDTNPTLTTLLAMGNSALTNGKAKTVTATAGSGLYTYYTYCAAAGDLSSIIMDGAAPVLGAFTKLSDKTGTNSYGATVTYRVYKSNAPAAFTNNSLAIS